MAFFANVKAEPTFGSMFGQGLISGAQQGLSKSIDQFYKQKQLQQQTSALDKALTGLPKEASAEDRFNMIMKAPIDIGVKKIYADKFLQDLAQEQYEKTLGSSRTLKQPATKPSIHGQSPQEEISEEPTYEGRTRQEWEDISRSPNKQASAQGRLGLRGLEQQEKTKTKSEALDFQKQKFAHESTAKYGEGIIDAEKRADDVLGAVKSIEGVLEKGGIGKNYKNIAYSYLNKKNSPYAPLFLNPDTQTIISANKTLMGGGAKEVFGSKPTEREVFWIENVLPNILKTVATNKASLDYFKKIAQNQKEKAGAYREITRKNGGYRPINIDDLVAEKMKEKNDKLVEEGYQLSEKISAPNPEKISGKSLTEEKAKELMRQANGDKEKARQLARQMGYEF